MPPKLTCPHCGNDAADLVDKWIEPISQIPEEAAAQRLHGTKYTCQVCGKSWIVPKLPLEGPKE